MDGLDFNFDISALNGVSDNPEIAESSEKTVKNNKSRSTKTHEKQFFRRFTSERALEELIDWDFEPGSAYHIISAGDIDSFSYVKMILRQQALKYAALSTWCMALQDVEDIERYLTLKRIARIDCYVGEIFKNSYSNEYKRLCLLHNKFGGRVAMFRNHSKVFVGFGERFDFVIESSANVNTNPRAENTVITINSELAKFYKGYFDDIRSYERNFDGWAPCDI